MRYLHEFPFKLDGEGITSDKRKEIRSRFLAEVRYYMHIYNRDLRKKEIEEIAMSIINEYFNKT